MIISILGFVVNLISAQNYISIFFLGLSAKQRQIIFFYSVISINKTYILTMRRFYTGITGG